MFRAPWLSRVSHPLITFGRKAPRQRRSRSRGFLPRVEGLETLGLCTFLAVLFFPASRILPAIPPQIVRHGVILGLYFLVNAAVLLLWARLPKPYTRIANETMLFVESGCYLAWAALFSVKTVLKNAPSSNRALTATAR